MTPFREPSIDWKQVGIIAGALAGVAAIARYLFLPLVEKAVRNILKPELEQFAAAVKLQTDCAKEMQDLVDMVHTHDDEIGDVFQVVRVHRDLLGDMNEIVPRAFGADRRAEERRRFPELPQLPERRRVRRRRDDE